MEEIVFVLRIGDILRGKSWPLKLAAWIEWPIHRGWQHNVFSFKGSIGEFLIFPVETPDFQLRDWMISIQPGHMVNDREEGWKMRAKKSP